MGSRDTPPSTRRLKLLVVLASAAACAIVAARVHGQWEAFRDRARSATATSSPVSVFDPLLGWRLEPGVHEWNGGRVTINEHGFRGEAPRGGRARPACRIVMVGDSFTFGWEPAEDSPIPVQLERALPAAEVVNHAAPAYGLDQMYLWWRDAGSGIDADLTIVAVIERDFGRVHGGEFLGRPKPRFELREGGLELANTPLEPVGREPSFADFVAARGARGEGRAHDLPFAILERFLGEAAERGPVMLLFMPDRLQMRSAQPFGYLLASFCARTGTECLDATPALAAAFADDPGGAFLDGQTHYGAEANRVVADALAEHLAAWRGTPPACSARARGEGLP